MWLEPLAILVVVVLAYAIAPGRLPLIGEETCRALHGIEMAQTGDWLFPTNHGIVILDRPPLQYWVLALVQLWVHPLDPLTVRLLSALVVYLTGLAAWFYARGFLDRAGRLVAGLAYPTMGQIFNLGRRVETDGLFALLMAAALLVWHHGYAARWRPWATWAAGAALAALATLTKGTQGPVAFFGAVGLFLLLRRDWRTLFSLGALLGVAVFAGCVAAFQIPFHLRAGWDGTYRTWFEPFTDRLDRDLGKLAEHVATFPLETLGAAAPWSLLALGVLHRGFWRGSERLRSSTQFLLVGCLAIFGPVWISEGGKTRYLIALYPLLAGLAGAVVARAVAEDAPRGLARLWTGWLRATAALLAVAILGLVGVTLADGPEAPEDLRRWAQPAWMLVVLVALSGGHLALVWRRAPSEASAANGRAARNAFSFACLLAVVFNGPVLSSKAWRSDRVEQAVAELRDDLGGAQLASFHRLHHKFLYHWYLHEEPIPIHPWPETAADVPAELDYFALSVVEDADGNQRVRGYGNAGRVEDELPFAWDEVARIDTSPKSRTHWWIVIGRRRPPG